MININKRNPEITKLLKDSNLMTKVYIYFSTKTAGDDFDAYEGNYTYSNLNPVTIKAYVRELTPETAYWKRFGLHEGGVKEIICDERYRNWFEKCAKIEIDGNTYQVYREGTGNRTTIIKRPFKTIRVTVTRKD